MSRESRLQVWAEQGLSRDTVQHVPRPTPGDVLYARPNPDRSRKTCATCFMWESKRATCMIHDSAEIVTAEMVCGYHVFGSPQTQDISLADLDPVEPALSGLIAVGEGSSCDNCRHYRARGSTQGSCVAVADPDEPDADFMVEPLGCCTRWRAKG